MDFPENRCEIDCRKPQISGELLAIPVTFLGMETLKPAAEWFNSTIHYQPLTGEANRELIDTLK